MHQKTRQDLVTAGIIDQAIELRAHRGLRFATSWLMYCGVGEGIVARVLVDAARRRPVCSALAPDAPFRND